MIEHASRKQEEIRKKLEFLQYCQHVKTEILSFHPFERYRISGLKGIVESFN